MIFHQWLSHLYTVHHCKWKSFIYCSHILWEAVQYPSWKTVGFTYNKKHRTMKARVDLKQNETLRRFTISSTSLSIATLTCSLIHSLTSSFINLFKEPFTPLSNFWHGMLLAPILSHSAAQEFTLNHQCTNTLSHVLLSWYRAAANQEIIIELLKKFPILRKSERLSLLSQM